MPTGNIKNYNGAFSTENSVENAKMGKVMNKKERIIDISKRTGLTLAFPVFIFVVMLILTLANGITYYASLNTLKQVVTDASLTTIIALAIYLQFKNGRFDFSGGATMIISAIIAGNITLKSGGSPILFMVLAIVFGIMFSLITAFSYIFSKVPIIICTIAITLVYESLTYLLFDAEGLNVISSSGMVIFGRSPYIFIPLFLVLALFLFFTYFTSEGRRAKLLSGNQKVAVSIGIKENKNVIVTYIICGVILGCGALIYGSQQIINPQSNLSTSSILFSYIVPVFIGMFIGSASVDVIGVAIAAIGMEFLNYGLDCLGVGAGGYQQIIFGAFMLAFYAFSARAGSIKNLWSRIFSAHKKKETTDVH